MYLLLINYDFAVLRELGIGCSLKLHNDAKKYKQRKKLETILGPGGPCCRKVESYIYGKAHGEHTSPSNCGELAHLISGTLSTTIFCHRGHYCF